MDLLTEIFKDLDSMIAKKEFRKLRVCGRKLLHFGLGSYIRNKYIWGNKSNQYILMDIYGDVDADTLSSKIIDEWLSRMQPHR